MEIKRFDVLLINLDPTIGKEIKKTRPCAVISPDEMNKHLCTYIIAPMTSVIREDFPTRIKCNFKKTRGQIVLDQIRTIDHLRIVKKIGKLKHKESDKILNVLSEMFAP